MDTLIDTFTSTGAKFFAHQEAMAKLRNGRGQPITTHVMLTDVCNHKCAFCSVQSRAGDSLPFQVVDDYVGILQERGLKSVILSGGGNPILYKCKETGANFNDVVKMLYQRGLEVGLITNGAKLHSYQQNAKCAYRKSWKGVTPDTLDRLKWVRISMSGLDHDEREVYVPDIDPHKTTLGFSYVSHDVYSAPEDPHHGKVSTERDLLQLGGSAADGRRVWRFEDRISQLTTQIKAYVVADRPRYVRLLPNCLEPEKIPLRCRQLQEMADEINDYCGSETAFVQYKPPAAPQACYLGYIHPVLNCDGYVYPCDSCVLNESAEHKFANPWRICHWSDIGRLYDEPVRSLIGYPTKTCPGCVFTKSNELLKMVVDGRETPAPQVEPEHVNFV